MRTSFTLPQVTVPIADWAAKNGIKKVVTFVADYGPGIDAEKFFKSQFQLNGGQIIGEIRSPLRSPDFAPFLQKVADLKPDAVFCFLPSGQGAAFMKQFGERGLDKSGIKLIATGDVTDDDQLNDMGDVALGVVNSHHYSAAHPSATNKKFVQAFEAANKFRPNFMAVAGYDGMHVIYNALAATKGEGGGDALLAAMKGQIFESPRGQILIDAQTRDIVQDVYIRKVERVPERPALQRRVRRAEGGQGSGQDEVASGRAGRPLARRPRALVSARRRRRAPGSWRRPGRRRSGARSRRRRRRSPRRGAPRRAPRSRCAAACPGSRRSPAWRARRRPAARRDGVDLRGASRSRRARRSRSIAARSW